MTNFIREISQRTGAIHFPFRNCPTADLPACTATTDQSTVGASAFGKKDQGFGQTPGRIRQQAASQRQHR